MKKVMTLDLYVNNDSKDYKVYLQEIIQQLLENEHVLNGNINIVKKEINPLEQCILHENTDNNFHMDIDKYREYHTCKLNKEGDM